MSTHKETSCFQTGLWAEMREPSICESCDLPEPNEEDGVACALPRALPPLPAPASGDEIAMIFHTSGSTSGQPKVLRCNYKWLDAMVRKSAGVSRPLRTTEQDVTVAM